MCDKKLFSCGFLCCTIHNRSPPDHRPLTIISHRQRKRWDENTSSSKGPHKCRGAVSMLRQGVGLKYYEEECV